ncbi:MAG: sel1 repeat family protein [Robiginitomaculum sp.]|nr:sel1 repeat family protein [Robiginitomaculum sp.]MBL1431053.1 sel1 repeat family protein [Robiginitomaculum sp.]
MVHKHKKKLDAKPPSELGSVNFDGANLEFVVPTTKEKELIQAEANLLELYSQEAAKALAEIMAEKGIESGTFEYAQAEFEIGAAFYSGSLGANSQSYEYAMIWFQKAAEKEHAKSQETIGLLFATGHGVEQSHLDAIIWYKKSFSNGNVSCAIDIAGLYVQINQIKTALEWYLISAEQNNTDAQFALGTLYTDGTKYGIEYSSKKAMKYFKLALKNGCKDAEEPLAKLERSRDFFKNN